MMWDSILRVLFLQLERSDFWEIDTDNALIIKLVRTQLIDNVAGVDLCQTEMLK